MTRITITDISYMFYMNVVEYARKKDVMMYVMIEYHSNKKGSENRGSMTIKFLENVDSAMEGQVIRMALECLSKDV